MHFFLLHVAPSNVLVHTSTTSVDTVKQQAIQCLPIFQASVSRITACGQLKMHKYMNISVASLYVVCLIELCISI